MSPRARSNRKLTATSAFEYIRKCSKAASSRRSKWIHPTVARGMPGGSQSSSQAVDGTRSELGHGSVDRCNDRGRGIVNSG